MENGYYRVTWPDGESLIDKVIDGKDEIGGSVEFNRQKRDAVYEPVFVKTNREYVTAMLISFKAGFQAGLRENNHG